MSSAPTADKLLRQKVGRQVRARRERLRLTQTQLGSRVGKEQSAVSRIETGDYQVLTIALILDLAYALRCEPGDLLDWPPGIMDVCAREPERLAALA